MIEPDASLRCAQSAPSSSPTAAVLCSVTLVTPPAAPAAAWLPRQLALSSSPRPGPRPRLGGQHSDTHQLLPDPDHSSSLTVVTTL